MRTKQLLLPCLEMFLCLLVTVVLNTPAYGHKIMVFAYPEEDLVYTEGYFADGKKAQDSLVEVFGEDGSKLLEGKTDENGFFSFPMPDVPEIRIVLTGSMGHRAECILKGDSDAVKLGDMKNSGSGVIQEAVQQGNTDAAGGAVPGEERIRAIVSEELDRKLAPLMREVALLSQDGPCLTDVIGGIGYIAGIMGLLMYFKARRKSDT